MKRYIKSASSMHEGFNSHRMADLIIDGISKGDFDIDGFKAIDYAILEQATSNLGTSMTGQIGIIYDEDFPVPRNQMTYFYDGPCNAVIGFGTVDTLDEMGVVCHQNDSEGFSCTMYICLYDKLTMKDARKLYGELLNTFHTWNF